MTRMSPEHVDVLIVGAGISGVGAGCRVQQECPGKTFAILESRADLGGTWDLFRFPGIRSDSDMWTLSYPFRPWSGDQAIVDGATILNYVRETARDLHIDEKIRFHHRAVARQWSSADARWTVDVERSDTGETLQITCNFLYACTGYYRYEQAYTPEFAGVERFGGEIVHPQFWTDDIDYDGKRVVVIGSGATAVTVVPALAKRAAHVTMLQRSPSYLISLPMDDPIARVLGRLLPVRYAYPIVRWKNVLMALAIYGLSKRRPEHDEAAPAQGPREAAAARLRHRQALQAELRALGPAHVHRPDGDFFEAINNGSVSVVTDHIRSFTERASRSSRATSWRRT